CPRGLPSAVWAGFPLLSRSPPPPWCPRCPTGSRRYRCGSRRWAAAHRWTMFSSIHGTGDGEAGTMTPLANSSLMQFDSYGSPAAESLLQLGLRRHLDGPDERRLLITEAVAAAAFVGGAGALALFGSPARSFSAWPVIVTILTYLVAAQVRYPVGSAWTAPTQLAFVPMLFVLPTPFVPLIVAACSVADQLP